MVTLRTLAIALAALAVPRLASADPQAGDVDPAAPAPPASAPAASAAPEGVDATARPRIHHAPVATAVQGSALEIRASIEHPELVRRAGVVYASEGKVAEAPFLRSGDGYLAIVPAADVRAPGLAYDIELENVDGTRAAAFATRDRPHAVEVMEPPADERERAQLARLGGRRSVASFSSDVVAFGTTSGPGPVPCPAGLADCPQGTSRVPSVTDAYWRVEGSYTYRILRTVAEISIRGGVVRGNALVRPNELDPDKNKVGLNYGAPTVRFRLADAWHLEAELVTSITEVGFSVGGGGALIVGDPYGSRLVVGGESIGLDSSTYFGSRFYSRVDLVAGERLALAPIVEVTDMPHAASFGVRLLAEANVTLGRGFGLGVRGGYQARKSTSGGPSVGGHVDLAF